QAVPPDCWPEARLVVVPCLRLLALRYPVHEYYSAARRTAADVPLPAPADTWLAVTRRDYVVRRCPLSRPEHAALHALAEGQSVRQAVGLAAAQAGSDLERLATELRGWFARWASEAFFRAVEVPG